MVDLLVYYSAAYHFLSVIEHCELAGGDASLRAVEYNEKPIVPHRYPGRLQGLAVADANAHMANLSGLEGQVRANHMNLLRRYAQTTAGEPLVSMPFTYIDDILFSIGSDDEHGLFVPANVQALALAHGIELASFVAAYDFAAGVVFITGFADMFLT